MQSGLGEVSDTLIDRLLLLLVTATQPNISRPATAIIRKLVIPSPHAAEENATQRTARDKANGKGKKRASDPEGSHRYGFNRIYGRMELLGSDELSGVKGAARAMAVVVKRLEGTGDLELVAETWASRIGFVRCLQRPVSVW